MQLIQKFEDTFKDYLQGSQRWESFLWIVRQLADRGTPLVIVETGCARQVENWHGDGQSTRLWDFLVKETGGAGVSFDISPESVAYAKEKCTHVEIVEQDSILGLRTHELVPDADLVYLDSFDYDGSYRAALHHIGELAALWERVKPGTLIAVDDCHNDDNGKHGMVKKFFDYISQPAEITGYITVWKKP